jgi:tol-pal system protein YbgF
MKLAFPSRTALFGIIFSASVPYAFAAKAPVIDVSSSNQTTLASQPTGSLAEQLASVERKLDARNRAQVNVQRQLDDMQTQVNELRGVTELHTHQLSQVLERQRELYQELDRRVTEALKPTAQVPSAIAVDPSTVTQNYSNDLTENESYDKALNLVLKEKRYEEAIPAFRTFNQTYPQSSYAPNAHYWLGLLLFNKSELAEAKKEFTVVVEQFKDSSKRPDALLKLGIVAQQQKETTKAATLFRQLLNEYPDSTSAQLAKHRLENL